MNKIIVIIILLASIQAINGQSDTLYIFLEKPLFRYKNSKNINTGFIIKSKDKRFVCDYYKFQILNYKGWDENGEDIYLGLKDLEQEVQIDSINYKTIKSLQNNKDWWQIHNDLSLKKKIYLIKTREFKNNSVKHYILPMIYEGTRKNIIPTDFSKK